MDNMDDVTEALETALRSFFEHGCITERGGNVHRLSPEQLKTLADTLSADDQLRIMGAALARKICELARDRIEDDYEADQRAMYLTLCRGELESLRDRMNPTTEDDKTGPFEWIVKELARRDADQVTRARLIAGGPAMNNDPDVRDLEALARGRGNPEERRADLDAAGSLLAQSTRRVVPWCTGLSKETMRSAVRIAPHMTPSGPALRQLADALSDPDVAWIDFVIPRAGGIPRAGSDPYSPLRLGAAVVECFGGIYDIECHQSDRVRDRVRDRVVNAIRHMAFPGDYMDSIKERLYMEDFAEIGIDVDRVAARCCLLLSTPAGGGDDAKLAPYVDVLVDWTTSHLRVLAKLLSEESGESRKPETRDWLKKKIRTKLNEIDEAKNDSEDRNAKKARAD